MAAAWWRLACLSALLTVVKPAVAQTKLRLSTIKPGTERVQLINNGDFQFQGPLGGTNYPSPSGWSGFGDIFANAGSNMVSFDNGVLCRAQLDSSSSVSLLSQTITLEPATAYVFSGYLWNMGNSTNHVSVNMDMNDVFNEPQITLAYTDSQADKGYFVYRIFNTTFTGTNVTVRVFYDGFTGTGTAPGYFPVAAQWDNIAITKQANFAAPQASGSAATLRPQVRITNPTNGGFAYAFQAGVAITADATDLDGSVTNVQFFAGTNKVGESSASPWTALWTNAVSGSNVLTAVATDNTGATTRSAPVSVTVVVPFTTTSAMGGARSGHSATLLPNGRVLVVGGFNGTVRLASSELYDPAAGGWTASGPMAIGRTTQTATLLSNGKVLVTGGHVSSATSTASCELYDPATGTWITTGAMATARGSHTATLLLNGKVLVAGGFNRNTSSAVSGGELYDPALGTWTTTTSMATMRNNHTATLLLNGKVLVTGGALDSAQYSSLSSAEVYDPGFGTWTTIGSMSYGRQFHTATLLPDGRVMVAGGGNVGYFTASAEIYNPATGTWSATGALGFARGIHSATLLPDGKVLAVGGNFNDSFGLNARFSAELYDSASGAWTATGPLNVARATHTATLLPSGRVLVAAGYYVPNNVQLSSAEFYASAAGPITLLHPQRLPGGAFQFAFTGAANGTHTILAAANLAAPLSNWTALGVAPEFSPGLFLFTNAQGTNSHPQQFYRVRSP